MEKILVIEGDCAVQRALLILGSYQAGFCYLFIKLICGLTRPPAYTVTPERHARTPTSTNPRASHSRSTTGQHRNPPACGMLPTVNFLPVDGPVE
jgi:hypothetical protein